MFPASDDQEIHAPEDATQLGVERFDGVVWQRVTVEAWGGDYLQEEEWPEGDDIDDWRAQAFGGLPADVYRLRWQPDDRRKILKLGPVIAHGADKTTCVEHPEAEQPAAGSVHSRRLAADARGSANPSPRPPPRPAPRTSEGFGRRPPTAPPAASPPPFPGVEPHATADPRLATISPVMAPQLSPELANVPLQQFLIVAQMSQQQSDRYLAQIQAMATAMIESSRQQTALAIETMRAERMTATGPSREELAAAVAHAVAPLADRLQDLDEDAAADADAHHALQQLAAAQKREEPRSFLEQVTGFLQTPAGAVVAQALSRAVTHPDGLPPPPRGHGDADDA